MFLFGIYGNCEEELPKNLSADSQATVGRLSANTQTFTQTFPQVKASFSPFGHPTQVNASWVTFINLFLANEIEDSLP